MNDEVQLEWLFDKVTSYVGRYKKDNNKIVFRCPICGDSQKNTRKMRGHYYTNTGSYYCFNCDVSCDGFKLLEYLSGDSYQDLKQEFYKLKYNGKYHKKVVRNNKVSSKIEHLDVLPNWSKDLPDNYIKYLTDRGIFDAPYLPDDYEFMWIPEVNQLVIPWYDRDDMIYYQKRNMSKGSTLKYIFPKDTFKPVAGLDSVDISFKYIICFEGFLDSIFCKNGVCIGGKNITPHQRKLIKERYPHHEIVLAFDNDNAGFDAMIKQTEKSRSDKYLYWANRSICKDVNDHVLKYKSNMFNNVEDLLSMIMSGAKLKLCLSGLLKKRL